MIKIGEFSKLTQTTVKTLRYYEQVGLLTPKYIDNNTNYRYYDTSQLIDFNRIISLRQLGLSIDDVKNILSGVSIEDYLKRREIELENNIHESKSQLIRIKLLRTKENEKMDYEVVIKEIPEYIVFYKEGILDKYQDVGNFVFQAGEEARQANPNLKCITPDYCFMEYIDGEYRESNIAARYSQAVEHAGIETKDIKFKNSPRVTVASIYHKGPYSNFRESYGFIMKWIEDNNYEIDSYSREVYIDGIWNKEDSNDWLTEIQVPIKRK